MTTTAAIPDVEPRVFGHIDYAVLEFERLRWGNPGRKEDAVRTRFGMTMTGYYARLRWILEQPEAAAYDIHLVQRLNRIAARRRDVRTRGTVATGVPTISDPRGVRPAMFDGTVR